MKTLLSIFLALFFHVSIGQNKNLDELFANLNNSQIVVVTSRAWFPEMRSEAGDEIIKLGKKVTPQIISLLTDQNKGIIAHFVLTEIWRKKLGEVTSIESTEGEKLCLIYNQLKLFLKDDESVYTNKEELNENKLRWKKFVENKGSR